jgi:acyl dehydratase
MDTNMTTPFDPTRHSLSSSIDKNRYFEDFREGEKFPLPSRTITDAHFSAFQAVSGDNHPIHYDREYCRRHGHPNLLAHGLHVAALLTPGAGLFPHLVEESLVGFLDQSTRFLKPLYSGDTVYPMLVVTALKPQRTTGVLTLSAAIHNQRRELILDGAFRFLLKLRTPLKA